LTTPQNNKIFFFIYLFVWWLHPLHEVYSFEWQMTVLSEPVTLGGLVVACLPLDPRFAGSNPAEDDRFQGW
jgi:hypothetical protein